MTLNFRLGELLLFARSSPRFPALPNQPAITLCLFAQVHSLHRTRSEGAPLDLKKGFKPANVAFMADDDDDEGATIMGPALGPAAALPFKKIASDSGTFPAVNPNAPPDYAPTSNRATFGVSPVGVSGAGHPTRPSTWVGAAGREFGLSVAEMALLAAEVSVSRSPSEVHTRFGMDALTYAAEVSAWDRRFAADPVLRAEYTKAYNSARSRLSGR